MARPVNADPEATRQRVLAAASRLFAERGIERTSVREIASAAGVSLGAVHHYFGTKEALHQQCLETLYGRLSAGLRPLARMFEETVRELEAAPQLNGEFDQLIDHVVRAGFRFARKHRAALRTIMRPLVEHGELDPVWRERSHLPFLARVTELLKPITQKDETDLRLAAQSITALAMRYALATPEEIALMVGAPVDNNRYMTKREGEVALRHVEDHLVRVAQTLLRTPVPESAAKPTKEGDSYA